MEDIGVHRVCGFCLSAKSLMQASNEHLKLVAVCFAIHISDRRSYDTLSTFICNTCNKKIQDCYKFRCQILESQIKLGNFDDSSKAERVLEIKPDVEAFESNIIKKEEVFSDLDNSVDSDSFSIENTRNNENSNTGTNLSKKSLKTKIISNSVAKKEVPVKKTKKIKKIGVVTPKRIAKKRKPYKEPLPFKLDKDALTCEVCNEKFTSHVLLKSHMAVHYPKYVCHLCGKPFYAKANIRNHLRLHNTKTVTCTICKKVVKEVYINEHMKSRHSNRTKDFRCPHCPEKFEYVHTRNKHMEKFHDIDIYKYICNFCPKKFFLAGRLSTHVRRIHFKELNYACHLCDDKFFSNGELKKHMNRHTGEKKFTCDICSKCFTKKWALTVHLRSHSDNVLRYKCTQCDKTFTQKGSLKVHVKNIHEKSN